ncbi:MAG TPA: hypothetical protein VN376_02695, partial [Longilinea sp.]|nr:hypothetical protein [Longilinea sp.]
ALHAAYLADSLHRLGVDLSVISYRRQYPAGLYPGRNQREPALPPLDLRPVDYLYDPVIPSTWKTVYQAICNGCVKVLLLPWWHTIWSPGYAWLTRRLRGDGVRVIYMVHNVLPHESHPADKLLARTALRIADGYIVHAASQKTALEQLFLPTSPIALSPHPLYPPQAELPLRAAARAALNIPTEEPLFLTFGFQRSYKGTSDLISAFDGLLSAGTRAHLAVIGEGWRGEKPVHSPVHRIDRYLPAEELALWIAAADWYVAPHRCATQSGSLALALGSGLQAIISDALIFQAVDSEAVNVEVFPVGDVPALTTTLHKVIAAGSPERVLADPRPGWLAFARVVMNMCSL